MQHGMSSQSVFSLGFGSVTRTGLNVPGVFDWSETKSNEDRQRHEFNFLLFHSAT